jgi:SAM-dependent methyltransferase
VVATDFFLDLATREGTTDVVWNLYEPVPDALAGARFDSIVTQATMEHLLDPMGVLRKLGSLLRPGGHLYVHTHTPLFPYHGWPRDYVRFFPDWFRDVGLVIPEVELVELHCAAGHAFAAYRKRPGPSG